MYDFPEVREATDAFWTALAKRLGTPVALSREGDWTAAWLRPDLLFSQTCGYPFTHAFRGKLKLVATPHYDADGCKGPFYRSIIFAREKRPIEEFRGSAAVINGEDSMSGMLALKLVFAPFAREGVFFSKSINSGSHVNSLAALQRGTADVAAIDCVTVAYLRRYRPESLKGLVEVARSPLVPGLPYVTVDGDVDRIRAALADVFSDSSLKIVRGLLLLTGYSMLSETDYTVIPKLEEEVERMGGVKLRFI